MGERHWLLVGPSGSGTRWHYDPHGVSGFNVLLQGAKLWLLWPPTGQGWGRGWGEDTAAGPELLPPGLEQGAGAMEWLRTVLLPQLQDPRQAPSRKLLYTVQREEEMMWVPSGWWHMVINMEPSVAYQEQVLSLNLTKCRLIVTKYRLTLLVREQVVTRHNLRACVETCRSYSPIFAARLQKHALAGHADD